MNSPVITTSKPLSKAKLRHIATLIRHRMVQNIIMSGQDLLKVKASLDHGKFIEWVERDVEMSIRTAQNYMKVAKWAKALPGDKYATIAHLPPTKLYLLAAASTPEDIENEVIADIESGKPVDTKEVKARIEEAQVEQEETSQDDPKTAPAKKRCRTREEIERDAFFDGRLPVLEQAAGVDFELPVPKLNAEDAKQAIKQIKKAEACLRRLRREIEKQHPNQAPDVEALVVEHQDSDEDDDPLVIPAVFKRGRTA
jgi:hypothetical protein